MEKQDRILRQLSKPQTANEIISTLFKRDVRSNSALSKGWRYYVHMNKLFAPLEREGLIKQCGTKIGETNREEKIWKLT